ncbi:8-amino-7-oxononanoate synthase 2 [Symmachiella macrocystis]|uniref:8-amino-7-ketopelargonate synthase n=1 Tax=Symmachiella macrocystis TaxID=2527985 RepID=A0A5C6BSA2_9PLAN|nr:8-amino-7-oxononanoate synthase [Symmachiella macrocystis]TWU14106.1 8-amino-7-oxononanoate synthase 2 [Symmachiella macrocystis]
MSNALPWINEELDEIERRGLRRRRRMVEPLPGGRCRIDGREMWNFAGNDYLSLSQDPRVIAAAQQAAAEAGTGATASALICGRTQWHARLEEQLAQFEGTESALLFPTGFAANMGVIVAVVGREDAVFSDRLNHASLVDGCRLSKAALTIYDRNYLSALGEALSAASSVRRRLIVTDSIFSMDGDAAPLADLCELAESHDAMLMIDEAHATGVFGAQGKGFAEFAGVEDRVHFRVGTLSKAVGASGGFVSGSQSLIEWLWNRARPQIFSTALPPPVCAASCAAVDIIRTEPQRRAELLQRCTDFRAALIAEGFATIPAAVAPIFPILLDDPQLAVQTAAALEERGFLVGAIRPPSVPPGTSRLRITLSWAHDRRVIEDFTTALSDVLRDVALGS